MQTRIYSAVAGLIAFANLMVSGNEFFDRAFANSSVTVPLLSAITSVIAVGCIAVINRLGFFSGGAKPANPQ